MTINRSADTLVLLVGSSPLPNYLAAMVLRPRRVVLIHSGQTARTKERLVEALYEDMPVLKEPGAIESREVGDAASAEKVRSTCKGLLRDAHLHYSGGTKIMAAHARLLFREEGGKDQDASYLDEGAGLLRFDDGYAPELAQEHLSLSVSRVLQLHGITWTPHSTGDGYPTLEDTEAIAKGVLAQLQLANDLYLNFRDQKTVRDNPIAVPESLQLSRSLVGGRDMSNRVRERWCKFLAGAWLEEWVAARARSLLPAVMVEVGVNGKRDGRPLEVDIVLIRGHRLYVLSITTAGWDESKEETDRCKSKLFEVALRARQLGGDLARPALVCLLHGQIQQGERVDLLRQDVADVWSSTNAPQVFGLQDVQEWFGLKDVPRLESLKSWLDS